VVMHAGAPEYLEKAPALLLFCWNSQVGTHNASDSDSGGRFINVGYGCCFQNLYLSATVWNISISSPFQTYNYDALRTDLSDQPLPNIYPMYLIGIGEKTILGDINGDNVVDVFDLVIVAAAYSSTPDDPNWNAQADLNNDDIIDIFDLVIVATYYGETI